MILQHVHTGTCQHPHHQKQQNGLPMLNVICSSSLGKLTLWWFVQLWNVKRVEAVVCKGEEFQCVSCFQYLMLGFAVFGCLRYLLVKRPDAMVKCLNLSLQTCDWLHCSSDCDLQIGNVRLQDILDVLGFVSLPSHHSFCSSSSACSSFSLDVNSSACNANMNNGWCKCVGRWFVQL